MCSRIGKNVTKLVQGAMWEKYWPALFVLHCNNNCSFVHDFTETLAKNTFTST